MKRTRIVVVLLGLFPPLGCAGADDSPAPMTVPEAVKGITGRELGGHMKFLASDLMRGRDTASHEIRLAAEYLASRLSAAGAEPGRDRGNGGQTYFQPFPLEVVTPLEGTSVSLVIEQNGSKRRALPAWGRCRVLSLGRHRRGDRCAGRLRRLWRDRRAHKIDDFEGIDVKGRFVLMFSGQRSAKGNQPAVSRVVTGIAMDRIVAGGALGIMTIAPRPPTVGRQRRTTRQSQWGASASRR